DAQIDVGAQQHHRPLTGNDLVVDADLFVHRALVAGERHHLSKSLKAEQHIADPRLDPPDAFADMRGDEIPFGDAELGCEIAFAHLRVFRARETNRFRAWFGFSTHVFT